jgi:penicillin-insensitive murein endopeptidase
VLLAAASLASPAAQPAVAQPAAAWGAVPAPLPGPARIIGGTSLGCIAGAVALPADGPGWQAVRVSRNRHWGHPMLVDFLRDFTGAAQARGFPTIWVGDMGQPRGGPMPYGHASHQNGLDVDIWLELSPKPALPPAAREAISVPSLVRADEARNFGSPATQG